MGNIFKKYITFFFLLIFLIIILKENKLSVSLACNGLTLWYQKMIPALFPFMILSGILLRTNLSSSLAALVKPVLSPIFKLNNHCIYCIMIGFLCGFPMGAKIIVDSLRLNKITKKEADFLLSFCNNIGPLYFIGYIAPLFSISNLALPLFITYGIPFIYGILLRYTKFSSIPTNSSTIFSSLHDTKKLKKSFSLETQKMIPSTTHSNLLDALDASINSAIQSITVLGGYMIFFNVLMIFPYLAKQFYSDVMYGISCTLLEITGGIMILSTQGVPYQLILILLPFGGISCIAQTFTVIKNTNLSISSYILHKLIQTCMTFILVFLLT